MAYPINWTGFELGDDSDLYATGGDVSFPASSPHSGTRRALVKDDSGGSASYLALRGVNYNYGTGSNLAMGTGFITFYMIATTSGAEQVMSAWSANGSYNTYELWHLKLNASKKLDLYGVTNAGVETLLLSGVTALSGSNYTRIDIGWRRESSEGAYDGFFSLKLNGVIEYVDDGLPLHNYLTDYVVLGAKRVITSDPYSYTFDDLAIWSDFEPGGIGIRVLAPNGAATATGTWVGPYTNINEIPPSGTQYVSTISDGAQSLWPVQGNASISLRDNAIIYGVKYIGMGYTMNQDKCDVALTYQSRDTISRTFWNDIVATPGNWITFCKIFRNNFGLGGAGWTGADLNYLKVGFSTDNPMGSSVPTLQVQAAYVSIVYRLTDAYSTYGKVRPAVIG